MLSKMMNVILSQFSKVYSFLKSKFSYVIPEGAPHVNFTFSELKRKENRMIITYHTHDTVQSFSATDHTVFHTPIVISNLSSKIIKNLLKDKNIKSIEVDQKVEALVQTQDWGIKQENIPAAWAAGYTGKGVKVAVIDTGVGPHTDVKVSGGASFVSYTTSYADDNGHGTHVAGIISAENNTEGVVGVAPDSEIYAVKVLDKAGSGYTSDIIKGIDWAVTNKMHIVNMSLGYFINSYAMELALNNAVKNGVVVVAAAGNSGSYTGIGSNVTYPAKYPATIAVGAIDPYFVKGNFSSTGPEVDVCAPGVDINSTYLSNGYTKLSGTSMASPFIAGELALLKEKYPTATAPELKAKLMELAYDIGETGVDPIYGYGPVIYREDPSSKIGLPLRTSITIEKSSETIPVKGLLVLKVTIKDENGKPVSGVRTQITLYTPSRMMYVLEPTTNTSGIATANIQGYNGYQTSELGSYRVTIKAYKTGYVGSLTNTTFTTT